MVMFLDEGILEALGVYYNTATMELGPDASHPFPGLGDQIPPYD